MDTIGLINAVRHDLDVIVASDDPTRYIDVLADLSVSAGRIIEAVKKTETALADERLLRKVATRQRDDLIAALRCILELSENKQAAADEYRHIASTALAELVEQ